MSETKTLQSGITRRSFLKTTAAVAGAASIGGAGSFALHDMAIADETAVQEGIFNCVCRSNCNFSCLYNGHVRDGKLVKLEVADYPDEGYTSSCLKGLSYLERIYHPERIKYPMRRAGERGSDEWERISWDEAIEEITERFETIIKEHGPTAIAFEAASGNYGYVNGVFGPLARLCCVIGATKVACSYDYAAGHGVNRVLGTGDWYYSNEPNSVLDSSMIIIWGTNPVLTAPHNWRWMQRAKENGTKIVTLDPIMSATAHKSDEYIQVTPGNDGYLALAMANYMIENDLIDKEFIMDKTTAPFLVRRDTQKHLRKSDYQHVEVDPLTNMFVDDDFYVWDEAIDGLAYISEAQKPAMEGSFTTPEGIQVDTAYSLLKKHLEQYTTAEASRHCGVSKERIELFAEEFAAQDAISVNITYGADHYVNGYLTTWAIAILMGLTGNFAKDGAGFTGVFCHVFTVGNDSFDFISMWLDTPEFTAFNGEVPECELPDIFATQELEGKPYPLKAMLSYSSNAMSNFASQREFMDKVLPNIEFWVVLDTTMCDSARYADLVLPVASWYEVEDIRFAYNNPYAIYQEKAIEPLYESKSDQEIVGLLGRAMGYEKSFPANYGFDEWCEMMFTGNTEGPNGMTFEDLKKEKVIQAIGEKGKPWIRGKSAPFPTESTRVQLYCENPAPRLKFGQDLSAREPHEHLVYYREPEEVGIDNPLREKYPLVFLQEHSRYRVHTQWYEVPMLRELDPEPLAKVSGVDAKERGVENGEIIEVFNDRGHAVLRCLIDESIAPGILSIPKGWQRNQFIDGCFQEMTQPKTDPYSSAFSYYDSLVDFRKYEGGE